MTTVDHHAGLEGDDQIRLSEAGARDFFELLKPRVMSLVVFTAFAGLMLAPVTSTRSLERSPYCASPLAQVHPALLNMWYDADIDAVMSRTARRPIPDGRVLPQEALAFGLTLSTFSVAILGLVVNRFALAFSPSRFSSTPLSTQCG